jgi:hypothetical protein
MYYEHLWPFWWAVEGDRKRSFIDHALNQALGLSLGCSLRPFLFVLCRRALEIWTWSIFVASLAFVF